MQVVDLSATSDKMLVHLNSWQFYYPIREWRSTTLGVQLDVLTFEQH